MAIRLNWDLDSIFSGGSESAELSEFLKELIDDLNSFDLSSLPTPLAEEHHTAWVEKIDLLSEMAARLQQVGSFAGCIISADVKDEKGLQLYAQVDQLSAQLGNIWTALSAIFAEQDDDTWESLLTKTSLEKVSFNLNQQRDLSHLKMSPQMEALANDLGTDGYHAWDRLYGIVSGDEEVEFQGKTMSLGQLQNKYEDDPEREIRRQAFELYESSWRRIAKVCAQALNNQAGFRLALYKHRGWDSALQEPLLNNRFTAETLETMWNVVEAKNDKLLEFFKAKAQLFGVDQLNWYDVYAPVGETSKSFSYEEAVDFTVDTVRRFNPDIADYCRMAVDNGWVELEDRSGKRAGAFCTGLPLIGESRVFMTFNGSFNGIRTLAHELGHGYHSWVMRDLPYGARRYTMSVAETASTFNESVINDACLKAAVDDHERLSLLASRLNDATAFLMNIRARFIFESAFFERRAKTSLGVDELSELMVVSQKKAFKNGLSDYHPLFWASKLHFYLTGAPFYNFPYTFGYLFSNGIYAQALAEGPSFGDNYVALLRDTGSMNTETLAKTHLGIDLTRPDFWENSVDRALADVDEFVALVNKL
ncbi:MAG: M3 family oligoendopeptidase [Proteobacteria bacterium]|nr:M3 family oligoendopeptidase [Pseudomonadota bacterium]